MQAGERSLPAAFEMDQTPQSSGASPLWAAPTGKGSSASPWLSHPVHDLLRRLAETVGCNIFLLDPTGAALAPAILANPLCRCLRTTPAGVALCTMATLEMAAPVAEPTAIYECPAGMYSLKLLIGRDDEPIAQLVLDGFLEGPPSRSAIRKLASHTGLSEKALLDAAREVPVLEPDKLQRIAETLLTAAKPLLGLSPAALDPSALIGSLPAELRPKPAQGMIITDRDGVILEANQAVLNELGYEATDLQGKRAAEFHLAPPSLLEPAAWFSHLTTPVRYRARFKTSNQQAATFDVTAYTIGDPASGLALHLLQRAPEQVEPIPEGPLATLARFETAYYHLPLAALLLEGDTIIYANPRAADLTGRSLGELLQRPWEELLAPDSRALAEQARPRLSALEPGESASLDVQLLRGDRPPNVRADFSVLPLDGRRVLVCTLLEVPPDKAAPVPAQAIRHERRQALSRAVGPLSHHLNNMLVTIASYVGLVQSELPADHPVVQQLHVLEDSSTRVASLIKSLQAFAGCVPSAHALVDVAHLIRNVAQQVYTARDEAFEPHIHVEASVPRVLAEPKALTRAVRNVIQNAAEATEPGGAVEVSVLPVQMPQEALSEHPDARPGSYTRIVVRDYGPGISPRLLPRIFEPFITDKPQHLGLGLSEAYGILRSFGGFLEVSSTPGEGTTVDLYLPAGPQVEEEKKTPAARTAAVILVISQNQGLLATASDVLQQAGHDVITAASGADGVDVFSRYRAEIDLVLLDLAFTAMNGRQALHFFRRVHEQARIVVLANALDDAEAQALIEEGALDVIRKPFTAEGLQGRIEALLGSRRDEETRRNDS